MKRIAAMVLALVLLAPATAARLLAHEGHEHKIMGTVTMAAADHLMVKAKDGADVTVKITKETKLKGNSALKIEQIKLGTRVVVTAVEQRDKSLIAKTIRVGTPPAGAE